MNTINLKRNLKKYKKDIINKIEENGNPINAVQVIKTIKFSFSDIVVDFVEDNRKYFKDEIEKLGIEAFIDEVLTTDVAKFRTATAGEIANFMVEIIEDNERKFEKIDKSFSEYSLEEFNKEYNLEYSNEKGNFLDYIEANDVDYMYADDDKEYVLKEYREHYESSEHECDLIYIPDVDGGLYLALY